MAVNSTSGQPRPEKSAHQLLADARKEPTVTWWKMSADENVEVAGRREQGHRQCNQGLNVIDNDEQ